MLKNYIAAKLRWALKVVLTIAVANILILCLFSLVLQVAH